jgi:hypothetical protein
MIAATLLSVAVVTALSMVEDADARQKILIIDLDQSINKAKQYW